MTLPYEEHRALKRTVEFLRSILHYNLTGIRKNAKEIRETAIRCLRHFPMDYRIDELYGNLYRSGQTVDAIRCPTCGDTVFSRSRHDMRWCSCGSVAIDGGRDYVKICAQEGVVPMPTTLYLDSGVDFTDLVEDWNTGEDKYGLIKDPTWSRDE